MVLQLSLVKLNQMHRFFTHCIEYSVIGQVIFLPENDFWEVKMQPSQLTMKT